jgi:hypothetical protein
MVNNILPWLLWIIGIAALSDIFGLIVNQFRPEHEGYPPLDPSIHTNEIVDPETRPVIQLMNTWDMIATPSLDLPDDSENPLRYWVESSRVMRESLDAAGIELQGCRWFGWEQILLSHPREGSLSLDDKVAMYRQAKKLQALLHSLIPLNAIHSIEIEWLAQAPYTKKELGIHSIIVNFNASSFLELWRQLVKHTADCQLVGFKLTASPVYHNESGQNLKLAVQFTPLLNDIQMAEAQFPWSDSGKVPIWLFPDTFQHPQESIDAAGTVQFTLPNWVVLHYNLNERWLQWQGTARFEDEQTVVISQGNSRKPYYSHHGQSFAVYGAEFVWSLVETESEPLLFWTWGPCGINDTIRQGEVFSLPVYLCVSESINEAWITTWVLNVPKPWNEGIMEFTGYDQRQKVAEFNYTDEMGKNKIWHLELN